MKSQLWFWFLVLFTNTSLASSDHRASVELHSHLFMNEGIGWLFDGQFFGPLKAKSWKDRYASQTNPQTVEESKIGILVVALYTHRLFNLSLKDSIRRQIDLAERFVKENPSWMIARSPLEAKNAIREGKRVLVLAIEGAAGVLESEEDLTEFIDRRGVRIVTPLHFLNDRFGGAALMAGAATLLNPWAALRAFFSKEGRDPNGILVNSTGLKKDGRWLIENLTKRKVWIDLSHASDRAQDDLRPILKNAGQPFLYTHTVLRHYHGAERGISREQLLAIREWKGMIGLMPSKRMLNGTVASPENCPPGCPTDRCQESIHVFATQYNEIADVIGSRSIGMGSDYNAPISHLPHSCETKTALDHEGLWHIGQQDEVWKALKNVGGKTPEPLSLTVDRFLELWSALWES